MKKLNTLNVITFLLLVSHTSNVFAKANYDKQVKAIWSGSAVKSEPSQQQNSNEEVDFLSYLQTKNNEFSGEISKVQNFEKMIETEKLKKLEEIRILNTLETPIIKTTSKLYHPNLEPVIQRAAVQHKVDPNLLYAVISVESNFNQYARSPKGAMGLMQLMPATAARFSITNPFDAHQNINAGAKYLSWLLKRFNGDVSLALAGYNAGEGNVDKYRGIPPFRETMNYVQSVMSKYKGY